MINKDTPITISPCCPLREGYVIGENNTIDFYGFEDDACMNVRYCMYCGKRLEIETQ